ncbi:putative dsRNA-binding protein [Streptomyces sp. NPDC101206]|uniref:putative dsRNA-binding protein n=1 Tax=Streptomyces sp. NPDC101206 TaxID=3366128 RepID=UPI00380142E9
MNEWVGIVALRETAPPTPVHKIALAIELARTRTAYTLGGVAVPYPRMRSLLRRVGQRYAQRAQWDRWAYCVDLAGAFFNGFEAPQTLPRWLTVELRDVLAVRGRRAADRTGSRHEALRGKAPVVSRPSAGTDTGQRPAGHSTRALRPQRVLTPCDVVYRPLPAPPEELVAVPGATVCAEIRRAVQGWNPGPEAVAWLGLASEHRSHLYERRLTEAVTPQVLGLLDRLGATTLEVALIDGYTRQVQPEKAGQQSAAHAVRRRAAEVALGQWVASRELARLGAGEALAPAASVFEGVGRQILGALSLLHDHETAVRLVSGLYPAAQRPLDGSWDPVADPVSIADSVFRNEGLTYDFEAEGPDHQKVFRATARTRSGRIAHGTGHSKKTARLAAAQLLLDGLPQQRSKPPAPRRDHPLRDPLPYLHPAAAHRDAVRDLADMFELPRRADGFLAQALTHASWVHENQSAVAASHQRDHQLLAHHGSLVITHLAAHARVHHVLTQGLTPDDDDGRFHTPSDDQTARLGTSLALSSGLLASRGQTATSRTAVSDAAQAVVAAAWRTFGPRLLERRPEVVDTWINSLEHRHDPSTALHKALVPYGATCTYEFRISGEEHLRAYQATAVLQDAAGREHRWPATPRHRMGKTDAAKATAQEILDVLAAPGDVDQFEELTEEQRGLLRYLLQAQLDGPGPSTERQVTQIMARGDLGADLLITGDIDAFRLWADRAQAVLGTGEADEQDAALTLYRRVLKVSRTGPRSLLSRMAAGQGDDASLPAVRQHAAAVVRQVLTAETRTSSVRETLLDWWMEAADHLSISVHDGLRVGPFVPTSVQLGALSAALRWCSGAASAAQTSVEVELTAQDDILHVWIGTPGVEVRSACDGFARLVTRTLPYVDCLTADDHMLVRLYPGPTLESVAGLAAAGLRAHLNVAEPESGRASEVGAP